MPMTTIQGCDPIMPETTIEGRAGSCPRQRSTAHTTIHVPTYGGTCRQRSLRRSGRSRRQHINPIILMHGPVTAHSRTSRVSWAIHSQHILSHYNTLSLIMPKTTIQGLRSHSTPPDHAHDNDQGRWPDHARDNDQRPLTKPSLIMLKTMIEGFIHVSHFNTA